ncbi:conserved hypothetical protein [Pyrenophora tritici-repentis Pt-1C-BFP]|uniref:Uncharacterized protein n=1 Tax=Pyrenophora tritici-repentis (strain Pt-1C-BFP) TaxID=426418 RepID=B2WQ29_PYRTR|nr:uncharacterized protein PTRG_12097 [Pyrenophora tritici-repentis Pt-1C-BFP]EDU46245.1 conserved hypothetical protein [Pyrenophora tritici-repentis Pt-1C-BFP]
MPIRLIVAESDFYGLNMADVAPLAYAANPITEPALILLGESFDRLIECAHRSIREDKISVFDQAQINSFISGRSGRHDRMLMVKLAKKQLSPLQRLSRSNASLTEEAGVEEIVRDLDRACLLLCIALLDHTLQGDHFESVVLSFLAVLGIDGSSGGVFRGPLSYSPDLSKFVKMAQMLVVQRSVVAAEDGEVEHPSYMLDEMRERFMVRGSRTAFDWACRLRSYAKKVVSNTTSLGYIAWSEDGSLVTYKDTGFSMDALRKFIAVQVKKAQQELEDLLLLHPEEARDDIVPPVYLYRLQDNHSNGQKGWNFLKDQRNADQLQEGGDRWLLNRVLENRLRNNQSIDMIDSYIG